ncbi:Circadian clock protein kinase KaiC [Massilia sp. Bi118]|uniref:ATPase domain-containing protein n=1 Tax=Massilia sp. Bi118 TaxID=2822346 RepID=UPI001D65343E|nr:ATPase domain-containing protein [Massilia sp. Bi118]CAH0171084.1 Circadian clock protein kinase KaiC [Massilia sp. Bi118]
MTDKVRLGLLETGVPGLDVLLGGGLTEYSFTLIAGAPGSGKTTLAHQIMFALAGPERRALFFTVLGEPPLKMLRYQQQFSFFDMDKVGPFIRYVNLADDLRAGHFLGVLERIMREVEDFGPGLVFVDSFRSVMQSARAGNEGLSDLQQFIQELGSRMATWQATTFLIGEYSQADVEANPIITVADGMLTLYQAADDNSALRKLRVNKMRGQAHMTGAHTMRIGDDGIRVYPRLLPPLATDRLPGTPVDRNPCRIPTGVPGVDELMHGGLPQGHTMLVSGPTGAGKTIMATRFLQAGAALGEKGVALFFEKGTARLRNAELAKIVQQGHVSVVESRSLSLSVEELMDEMCSAIDRTGATRVVIDSLSEIGLYLAPEVRADLRVAVFRTLSELAKRGVSALVTVGTEDDYTRASFSPDELCFLTDAVLSMRYAEFDGAIRKFMTVVKVRGCDHSCDLREYTITAEGIEVYPKGSQLNGVLVGRPTLGR